MENIESPLRIVVDVDGVILNFNRGFVDYYNTIKGGIEIIENTESWDWGLIGPALEDLRKHIKEYIDNGPHLEIIDGEWPELMQTIRKNKHYIIIVTAYHNHESRIKNLKHYGIEYDEIHFTDQCDKVEKVLSLKPHIVIEDCPRHVNALSAHTEQHNMSMKILVPSFWNYVKNWIDPDSHNVSFYNDIQKLTRLIFIGKL